jgi:dimethylaniline monooxygenase (N-oxide forming)
MTKRVCVIGAGSSGIAACKVLHHRGVDVTCYEAGDRVGGNWVYENSNGMSSAYRSLYINTSKLRMQYSDFPMPAEYPDFPHHTQIARYFDEYVDHFGVRPLIRFRTRVLKAEPREGSGWEITADDGSRESYDALLVANGHHWDMRWPEPPFAGEFRGTTSHAHLYKTPDEFAGKRVVVVGFGNSAIDIACELSRVAAKTMLSARRGFHVVPKHIFGKPLDQQNLPKFLPFVVRREVLSFLLRMQVGDVTKFGLPKPDHKLLHAHPTISSELLNRIAHGAIDVKPHIDRLDGDAVVFVNGAREPVDHIIYCTGYKVTFPFFRPEVMAARNNDLPLFKRVFHPAHRDLFFVGLLQPLGAIMPLAELQSEWVTRYLLGEYEPPPSAEMEDDIRRERGIMLKRYGAAPRHTMQVDFDAYVDAVKREMKRGAIRAAR